MGAKQSRCCPCEGFSNAYHTTVSWDDASDLSVRASSKDVIPTAHVVILDAQGNPIDDGDRMGGMIGGMLFGQMYTIQYLHPGTTTYRISLKELLAQYLVNRGELSSADIKKAFTTSKLAIRVYNGSLA